MGDRDLRILIVEDEYISRILLKEMLSPFGECYEAIDGNDAFDKISQSFKVPEERFDLICLDIMLPGRDGHDLLKEIRNLEVKNEIQGQDIVKVIMVSSLGDTENIVRAMVNGKCQAYLKKPVSQEGIEEQLRYLHLIDNSNRPN